MQAHVASDSPRRQKGGAGGLSIIQAAKLPRLRMRSASRRNPIQFPTNRERPNREDANKIQGCDYHPGFQQIAFVDTETGEAAERRLTPREGAEQF
jgi:hypothetical protein